MKRSCSVLIIALSCIILLSISACEKKPKVPFVDTWLEAEQSAHAAEQSALAAEQSVLEAEQSALEAEQSELETEPVTSEDNNPPETSATISPKPTPTAVPVSPFENFTFETPYNQSSTYARKLHFVSGSDQTYFFGKDTLLSTPGITLDLETSFNQEYLYYGIYGDGQYSIDGSCAAVIVDWDGHATGSLVFCDGKSVVRIAENVDSFYLSSDGSHLAYLTGKYEHGVGGTLYLYNCQTMESELISEGVGRFFVLSPTGSSISYTTFYRKYDPDSLICYAKTGTEAAIEVGRDRYCIAISDDSKTIFCLKREYTGYKLYVYQELIEKLLCDSLSLEGPSTYMYYDNYGPAFTFNNDCTQIVYSDTASTWFYVRGEEPIVVFGSGNAVLVGKRSTDESLSMTLYNTYYQERILTDFARSRCSTSFSGTPNLCYVMFRTESVTGIFDEYLIPHTVKLSMYDVSQDEKDTVILHSYLLSKITTNSQMNQSLPLKGEQYLGETEDGRIFYVRENAIYSLDKEEMETKLTDLTGEAVPYCTPYLDKIFILDYDAKEYSFSDNTLDNNLFFYTLYVIDPDVPTETILVSEKVARYTLMIQGSDITYATFANLIEDSTGYYNTSVSLELFYSSDGLNFKSITTYVQDYYIMGG